MRSLNYLKIIPFLPFLAFADSFDKANNVLESIYNLVFVIAILMGIALMVGGGIALKNYGENKQSPQHKLSIALMMFLTGAMLFGNTNTMVSHTLVGSDAHCAYISKDNGTSLEEFKNQCMSTSFSEVTGETLANIERSSGAERAKEYQSTVTLILRFISLIGFVYFVNAINRLNKVEKGQERGGHGGPILQMLFSAAAINLAQVIVIVSQTLEYIGITI
jgi:uncharacterized membrane protein YidH (DUF202 family)